MKSIDPGREIEHEQQKRLAMFLLAAFMLLVETGLFAYVWYRHYYHYDVIGILYWRRGNWALFAVYAVMAFVFTKIYGGFKIGYLRTQDILFSQTFSILSTNGVAYIQLALIGRWEWLNHVQPMFWLTLADLLVATLWALGARTIYLKIYPPHQMILIYSSNRPDDLIEKLSFRKDKYHIRETIPIEEGEDIVRSKLRQYSTALIGDVASKDRNKLLKHCFAHGIRCYCIPKISDVIIRSADPIHLFDTPLLLSRNRGLTIEQKIAKRGIDLVLGTAGAILSLPFMLIIAIAIKFCDKGPILYRQERLTQNGKTFQVLKFRSMKVNSEEEGAQLAVKEDQRVTSVGKVLRNIHFDELPQLFNILAGDMSIVGPRPERPGIFEEYKESIPEFAYRLQMKAGLTGYAQVYGKYNTTPYDKLKMDLTYIAEYSLWLDFKLMFMTAKILFQKETTEGIDEGQKTALKKPH